MKRIKGLQLIVMMLGILLVFSACAQSTKEDSEESKGNVRLAVYATMYDGYKIKNYPDKILTDDTVLNMIDNATGFGPTPDGEELVMYRVEYANESGQPVSVMIFNNGKVSTMIAGLKYAETYFSESELLDIINALN